MSVGHASEKYMNRSASEGTIPRIFSEWDRINIMNVIDTI
jgi:hypothetical protein